MVGRTKLPGPVKRNRTGADSIATVSAGQSRGRDRLGR